MAHMEMLDAGKKLEVRTGDIVLTVTATETGGIVCEARPQVEGLALGRIVNDGPTDGSFVLSIRASVGRAAPIVGDRLDMGDPERLVDVTVPV